MKSFPLFILFTLSVLLTSSRAAEIRKNPGGSTISQTENDERNSTKSTKFLEPNAPFLRSALTIKDGEKYNLVRRGLLIPLGGGYWACFDPDLLRWAAFWKAPGGKAPLTYDSMAAISYPDGKAKAHAAPALQGDLIFQNPELPGIGPVDSLRATLVNPPSTGVGPLPVQQGRWLGLRLFGKTPVLQYLVKGTAVSEFVSLNSSQMLQRHLRVAPHAQAIQINVGGSFQQLSGENGFLENGVLTLPPSQKPQVFHLGKDPVQALEFPKPSPAISINPTPAISKNPPPQIQGAFTIRPIAVPSGDRAIRPTDIAFLKDGTALLSTLDGDIWEITGIENDTSSWVRIASGIYESISLETTPDDRIFVLGRDQVTELIDHGGDPTIEEYRNASDAFLQTLQTRDYATSLAVQNDGSFLVAKGGIHNDKARSDNELSAHRGTIVHLSADGSSADVLADGLRLPYVGLRKDGAIFASDQQGNFVPSTPIHLIENHPFLGHAPTNFQNAGSIAGPLLWFPYQANRSAAAFATTSGQAFPDPGETFLQVSWGGRLFAIETPDTGQAFSWQLPLQLDFPSLNATSHPKSGRLYVTGLGISGYLPTTPELSGLASLEQSSPLPAPTTMDVREDGISITFNRPLKENETIVPGSPALRMFNIQRSPGYGSGHFKWDGAPGEQRFQPTSFSISEDRRTLQLVFDQLYRSDVVDLFLNVTSGSNILPLHLFTRPAHLEVPDESDLQNLADHEAREIPVQPGDPDRGKLYFTNFACAGCHSLDDTPLVGPSLLGIASRADGAFIKQSILEPNAVVTEGYPAAMPSFSGVLSAQELTDLLAYLKTLE